MKQLLFYLKVSRPGLWFATVWLYLLPTSQMNVASTWEFWYGLFYICFPLNFMTYGWNDIVDHEVDALNPRKDNFWFGAKADYGQLKVLWKAILVVQLLFYPMLIYIGGFPLIVLLLLFLLINGLYNLPEIGLRSIPPLELLCQFGYLLIVPLSVYVNNTAEIPITTYLYLFLFAIQSHLMGEVMDIEPDRATGRVTTATKIGMKNTKLLIIGIVVLELVLLITVYQEYVFAGMLGLGLLWLLVDLFLIFKQKTYTLAQMKLFGALSNGMAILTMAYVWYTACLV